MIDKQKDSGYQRMSGDFYVEPSWCVELLLGEEHFEGSVYDPAAGSGTVVSCFKERGFDCFGSDLFDRDWGFQSGIDFLKLDSTRHQNIVTNPPYKSALGFLKKSEELEVKKAAFLVRLDFLSSQSRKDEINQLSKVIVLAKRPSMPPGGLNVKRGGGQHDFCWIISERDYPGPPVLKSLSP